MGDLFGIGGVAQAAGEISAAVIAANAQKDAVKMQLKALQQQRDFVYSELEPNKISGMATAQDVQRAKDRLALQGITDPALLQTRYAAQQKLLDQVQGIGSGASDQLAAQAVSEFSTDTPGIEQLKTGLIDAALGELEAGATLPPDVQAELVRAGLEQGSLISGRADPRGIAGTTTRKMIGERALQLKADRQKQAAALGTAAQNLSTSRANILGLLFPQLKQQETQNQALATNAFGTANAAVPEVGLGGNDIANIWMARVGATNQLAQQSADAAARGAAAQGQIWSNAVGGATRALAPAISNIFAPSPQPAADSGWGGWAMTI